MEDLYKLAERIAAAEVLCFIYIKLTEPGAVLQDFGKQPGHEIHL